VSRVDIRIDELVLEGVSAHEAPAVAEALRAELARLVAGSTSGAWPEAGGDPEGAAGAAPLVAGDPAALGVAAARAVHRAVRGSLATVAGGTGNPGAADPAAIPAGRRARPASPWAGIGAGRRETRPGATPGMSAGNGTGGVA
jgi:hypothetical protein